MGGGNEGGGVLNSRKLFETSMVEGGGGEGLCGVGVGYGAGKRK